MRRLSLRLRWTLVFGALFLLVGGALLTLNYVLVGEVQPNAGEVNVTAFGPSAIPRQEAPSVSATGGMGLEPGAVPIEATSHSAYMAVSAYRDSTMRTLLWASGSALLVVGAAAVGLGWVGAGRALRPVHAITETARELGARDLDRRINLSGPDDELKELADTFDGMLDRLAAAFDAQTRFAANASHELRTPLTVQRTLIEVAMSAPDASADLLRLGERLLDTNQRSESLIDGLLMLARADRGLTARHPVRLDEVVSAALRGPADGVTVTSTLEPCVVPGDTVLLERLVANLFQNAVRYNVDGGTVHVEVTSTPPRLVVSNTGPVVPASAVPDLFEPFRRLGRERVSGSGGCGLGLSIVRAVANAHGGSVHIEPNPDGGLVVTVDLPA
ncbi:ATP-binding protein [Actinokineospora sp. HUAS TT18]|uniref:ATP-binding protein n=1 Tax=Actinokineospora sp. HUAS TT18 TaxID=3447451 RepID=UPI003F51EB05